MCKTLCVSLFADIIIRSSDIDLEFVKMLHHPSSTTSSSHRTILTASDGTNHVVYNLHTMSPNSNIISCDSIEETTTVTAPITHHHAEEDDEEDITVQSALDDDLNEFVICEKTDSKSPGTSSYNVVVVASSQSSQNVMRHTIADPSVVTVTSDPTSLPPAASVAAMSFTKESSDEKAKFMCSKCGSKFSALRNMKRHYHHECGIEPKHGCDFCSMRFKRRNLLKYHVLRKHTAKN